MDVLSLFYLPGDSQYALYCLLAGPRHKHLVGDSELLDDNDPGFLWRGAVDSLGESREEEAGSQKKTGYGWSEMEAAGDQCFGDSNIWVKRRTSDTYGIDMGLKGPPSPESRVPW